MRDLDNGDLVEVFRESGFARSFNISGKKKRVSTIFDGEHQAAIIVLSALWWSPVGFGMDQLWESVSWQVELGPAQ